MKTIILLFLSLNSFGQKLKKNKLNIAAINNIDVYIRLGDSNESGGTATQGVGWPYKYNSILPNTITYYKPDRTSTANGAWLNWSDSTPTINRYSGYWAISGNGYSQYQVGCNISFAYSMDSAFKKKVGLIVCALGGTSLMIDWASGTTMYNFFYPYTYSAGIAALTTAGYKTITIKGVIVRLGTNDCITGTWNNTNFKAALQSFVSNIRTALALPNLPFYWVQVNSTLSSVANYPQANVDAVRAAITACATISDPAYIANFNVLNYDNEGTVADGIHYDMASCIYQGLFEAQTMISLGE